MLRHSHNKMAFTFSGRTCSSSRVLGLALVLLIVAPAAASALGTPPTCSATECPAGHKCFTHYFWTGGEQGTGDLDAQSYCCENCSGCDVSEATTILAGGAERCGDSGVTMPDYDVCYEVTGTWGTSCSATPVCDAAHCNRECGDIFENACVYCKGCEA